MNLVHELVSCAHGLYQQNYFDDAAEVISIALRHCDNETAKTLQDNLQQCYWQVGKFDQLIDSLRHIKQTTGKLRSDQQLWLCNCLRYQGRYQEVESALEEVQDQDSKNLALGWLQHRHGNTRRAFELTESARSDMGWTNIPAQAQFRRWRGESVPRLVLLEEAGDGDMMLFARWIPNLQTRCDEICYLGTSTLSRVLQRCFGVRTLTTWRDIDPGTAVIPMMSLAHELGIEYPEPVVYFHPDINWIYYYSKLVPKNQPHRIGICWSGASNHAENHLRSVSADVMISHLGDLGEILSLQMDKTAPPGVTTAHFQEWEQTLALINSCDVVVSVDTAVAHAAAALGVPTIVLTHRACYYTWRADPPWSTSSWYTQAWSATQPSIGDWTGALTTARQHVIEILTTSTSTHGSCAEVATGCQN